MKRTTKRTLQAARSQAGFGLAEVIAAAVVIGIAIAALVSVARKGREIDITFNHHRRARAILDSCFESYDYHYDNYPNFPEVHSRQVVVDSRNIEIPDDDLYGELNIGASADSLTAADGTVLPYVDVVAAVTWAEPESKQRLTLSKRITQP